MDQATSGKIRKKRKAESQDNERLSKRLSLLNLERNGQKLYVPVEQPALATSTTQPAAPQVSSQIPTDDYMQVDDTKHKVYIYDLDAELSDSESSDDGKLVFLPDIQKHLRESRIPPSILANSEGEFAGHNQQLVLYNVPTSLTVPEEQDSVRKAIIETRARVRARQEQKRESEFRQAQTFYAATQNLELPRQTSRMVNAAGPSFPIQQEVPMEDDPDAMDLG